MDAHVSPPSVLRNRPAGSTPTHKSQSCPGWTCQIRVTVIPDSFENRGPSSPWTHFPPKFFERITTVPQCSLVDPAKIVLPSRGSRIAWRIVSPSKYGPFDCHRFRSREWKMNRPFRVPASTTVSPFLMSAMSTTRHGGKDVHDVAVLQSHVFRSQVRHGLVVHEHEHIPPHPPLVVEEAVSEAWKPRVQLRNDVREGCRVQIHGHLPVRVLAEGAGQNDLNRALPLDHGPRPHVSDGISRFGLHVRDEGWRRATRGPRHLPRSL